MTRKKSEDRTSKAPKGPGKVRPRKPAVPAISLEVSAVERPSDPNVAARIRELEERVDQMIDARARERDAEQADLLQQPMDPSEDPAPSGSAASLPNLDDDPLSTDLGPDPQGRPRLAQESDEFGYDPAYERKLLPIFHLLYEKYFRVETFGVEHVPAVGRCLLVANHSGTVPMDGLMLRLAVRREHASHREVRWLAEDAIFHFPFLGTFTNRVGAVRACQENAQRLLGQEALVAVFPEGMKGIGKLFKNRYRLQRFGRGGFVKLCLKTHTPIVPVAIVGGEETNPMFARVDQFTKALGIPYIPVTPTFPLLGPVGLLPAPTKWKILFGEPITLESYGAESADDEVLVARLTEQVRGAIQATLDTALTERRSVWFG
jgi:1-acyl-sn-glycerol-3-phosphate acyltransferase